MQQSAFLTQFKAEVKKSLLLEEADRQYWLANCENLPNSFLLSVYRLLKTQNGSIEEYIHVALENDPDHIHLTALKAKIKKLQLEAMEIDENIKSNNVDAILKEIE